MELLWFNTVVAASASMVWFLWTLKWVRRRQPVLAALYATAAVATLVFAFGFATILAGGDAAKSAIIARQWVWGAVGLPAVVRFIELLREESRHIYADRLLSAVERRADARDKKYGRPRS